MLYLTARQDFKVFHMQGIWDQMITDLEFSVQHMKETSELPKGQAPRNAARMLLAKYYMMNLRFADAEAQMDALINGSENRLFTLLMWMLRQFWLEITLIHMTEN